MVDKITGARADCAVVDEWPGPSDLVISDAGTIISANVIQERSRDPKAVALFEHRIYAGDEGPRSEFWEELLDDAQRLHPLDQIEVLTYAIRHVAGLTKPRV